MTTQVSYSRPSTTWYLSPFPSRTYTITHDQLPMAPTVNPSVAEVMPGVKRRGRRSFSSKRLSPGSVSSWLGIRPVERQLMRPWLIDQIDSQEIPGLSWVDPDTNTTFRVPWKHGSRQGWNCNKDACLFKRWARHTGIHTYVLYLAG